jgi:hypothetical protein
MNAGTNTSQFEEKRRLYLVVFAARNLYVWFMETRRSSVARSTVKENGLWLRIVVVEITQLIG